MRTDILIKIRNNTNLNMYIKYHSYWYKELLRNPANLSIMEEEIKKEFKLTAGDKISRVNEKMEMIRTLLEVIR